MGAVTRLTERVARWVASAASATAGGRLLVLTYHRVLPVRDELIPEIPDVPTFTWQMRLLAEQFRPLPLTEATARLAAGTLPRRAVSVTFDDGYLDNATVAYPILRAHRVPATLFVATGYLDGGRMFNDTVIETVRRLPGRGYDATWLGLGTLPLDGLAARRHAFEAIIGAIKYRPPAAREEAVARLAADAATPLPDDLMMTRAGVKALDGDLVAIGAHTRRHPILAETDAKAAEAEIADGRDDLVGLLNRPVPLFAYPNGRPGRDYRPEHVEMVRRAGFATAVSTAWGAASRRSAPLEVPRIAGLGAGSAEFALRLARNYLAEEPAR